MLYDICRKFDQQLTESAFFMKHDRWTVIQHLGVLITVWIVWVACACKLDLFELSAQLASTATMHMDAWSQNTHDVPPLGVLN